MEKAAHELSIETRQLKRWVYGDVRPSLDWAVALEREFGVGVELWTEVVEIIEDW